MPKRPLGFMRACLSILIVIAPTGILQAGETANTAWPTYGFSYANTRHVPMNQIDSSNVGRLAPAWRFVLGPHERVETTPIVVGHTMYATTGAGSTVAAIDAVTGKLKWRYRPVMGAMSPCCGALNRGVAFYDNRVFLATLDAHLIALDAGSGKPLWNVRIEDPTKGFSETMAPLAWNGMVFIGSSGSDYGIRGSVSAYRASDGARLWRWYAVSPGWEGRYATNVHGVSLHRDIVREKRSAAKYGRAWASGGGAVWITPALDASSATLFASTGNPSPVFDGTVRPGDNLYTDSIVALDARTGKMRWYYQQTPHDVWEYEAASPPVLFDARDANGKLVPAVGEAGKTRWLYILRRSDGSLLRLSQSFVRNTDVYDARPAKQDLNDQLPLRGTIGPISYDPQTHLAFVTNIDRPGIGSWQDLLVAVDVNTGAVVWKRILGEPHQGVRGDPVLAGALSTGGLVFASDPYGHLTAYDASNGSLRWNYQLGGAGSDDSNAGLLARVTHRVRDWLQPIKRRLLNQPPPTQAAAVDTSPIAYEVDGQEYIAMAYDDLPEKAVGGAEICVFRLPRR